MIRFGNIMTIILRLINGEMNLLKLNVFKDKSFLFIEITRKKKSSLYFFNIYYISYFIVDKDLRLGSENVFWPNNLCDVLFSFANAIH